MPAVTVFGVHVGLQHTTAPELVSTWQRIEALGFGWISVWDHFYGATGRPDDAACLEAVAMHAALACSTTKVRCGSLVYSVGYRHPAVLARQATTLDHASGGRFELGIGWGSVPAELETFGASTIEDADRQEVRGVHEEAVVREHDEQVIALSGADRPDGGCA